MATDALLTLQPVVTKTATFNGGALTLAAGTPRRGLKVRIIYSAATQASGSGVWNFSVDVSYNAGSTFASDFFADPPLTLSTTAQAGEVYIPFEISPTSVVNGTQIRVTATLSGAPVTPTITYQADITYGRP